MFHPPLDPELIERAAARRALQRHRCGRTEYAHFARDFEKVERGTILIDGRVIPSFPRISRVLRLQPGIERHLSTPFQVEEKVDGYNVRILRSAAGDCIAFTRSGHHCPFSTDRLPDFVPLDFFDDYPDWVLCAEVAGPENPYTEAAPAFIPEDVRFFVFDLLDEQSQLVPPQKRWEVVTRLGLPAVADYGVFQPADYPDLRELVRRVDAEGREGIVLKPLDGGRRIKYVTPSANIEDIRVSSELLEELPPHFYINRMNRFMLSLDELGNQLDDDFYRRIGRALLHGYDEAIARFREEHILYQTYRCRFRHREPAETFLDLLDRTASRVKFRQRDLSARDGFHVLTFDKIFMRSTSLLHSLFRGRAVLD